MYTKEDGKGDDYQWVKNMENTKIGWLFSNNDIDKENTGQQKNMS